MISFFTFKKKKPEEKKENEINSLLLAKLDRIIELLEQNISEELRNDGKNLQFDHVQIDYLENLIYRLDNIEIDQLSGKMVIGNYIKASEDLSEVLIKKMDQENIKKDIQSKIPSNGSQMEKTNTGYRFRNQV